jgi:hypothetical protein
VQLELHNELTTDYTPELIEDRGIPPILRDVLRQQERSWGGDFVVDTYEKYHIPTIVIEATVEFEQPALNGRRRPLAIEAGPSALPVTLGSAGAMERFEEAHDDKTLQLRRARVRKWRTGNGNE